ncbi:4076_t:CDS:2 [Paraglomus brasilianum]|uniref:4076_t:CDS:1 n=1 Tax=Paraglomus brasilianum TaxID=144538 RepID=A0A9N9CZM5_9GLOM|nr:4076_t:CDS:2 [Paraglomus brasilianum]
MPLFDTFFTLLSSTLQAPPDHLRILFILLASYPAALLYKSLPPNPNLKHLFSITFAALVYLGLFNLVRGFYELLASALVVYLISYTVSGKWAPILVFAFTMGHLSISHIYRQLYRISYDRFDISGPQMILVTKLTSFAFNVYDGQRSIKTLSEYQAKKRIQRFPSILEYLGYVFFFGGFLIGPAFEFADYRDFTTLALFSNPPASSRSSDSPILSSDETQSQMTDGQSDEKGYQKMKQEGKEAKIVIPNGFVPGMKKLLFACFWVVCLISFGRKYPMEWTLGEEYANMSFLARFFYINLASFCARFQYYIVWLLAEGACILVGLGFNGYDDKGKPLWDRVSNIDIVAYETANNLKSFAESWNMNTNKWLKNYVYLRLVPPGKKPSFFSTFATFATSAFWHGFYPGYYLMFMSSALLQSLHRNVRRKIRPIFLHTRYASYKPLYDFVGWFIMQSMISHLAVSFVLLSLRNTLYVWRLNYLICHVAILFLYVFFMMGLDKQLRILLKVEEKKEKVLILENLEQEALEGKKRRKIVGEEKDLLVSEMGLIEK